MKKLALLILISFGLLGCKEDIEQSQMCVVSTDEETVKNCKNGKLAYFRPDSWGNEQLPLNMAASYCDFNHQVMHTKAGVICVFTDKRIPKEYKEQILNNSQQNSE